MDIDQARTFLAIAAHGSFLEAAKHLHLTQSTVSARIQRLEDDLGARLFMRNRSGASLTASGRRFLGYAKRLIQTEQQARHDVGLPSRYRETIRIGGRIALWEGLLPQWVSLMRTKFKDVAIGCEIGFEEDLMRGLIAGMLDIALMYTPSHYPGLIVEHLFDEVLVLVSSRPGDTRPDDDYVYIDWGPGFAAHHQSSYPEMERPPQVANIGWLGVQLIMTNGGSCFLPARMAATFIASGQLFLVEGSPQYKHPAYMVYPQQTESRVMEQALQGLRDLARSSIALKLDAR